MSFGFSKKLHKLVYARLLSSLKEEVYFGCYGNPMPFYCKCHDKTGASYQRYLGLVEGHKNDPCKYSKTPYKHGQTRDFIETTNGPMRIESELYTILPK